MLVELVFPPQTQVLFELSCVAHGDDDTFILAIKNVTFLLPVEQQVSSHHLPCVLSSGCNKVNGKREKPDLRLILH